MSLEEGLKLWFDLDQPPRDKKRYQLSVRTLMYLAHTWLDLAYDLSVVSQFMYNLRKQHMDSLM